MLTLPHKALVFTYYTSLLKTVWEKENSLQAAISLPFFIKFNIVVCKLFQSLEFFVWERVSCLANNKILDSSKLKEFADNIKFDEYS